MRTLLGVRRAPARAGRAAQLGAGGRGKAVLPWARRGHRAAQAVGQRPAGRKGKIAGLAPGRALAFADDPAWGDVLRLLWQPDAPAPPEVLDGLVQVLVRWSASWERPVAVVAMPSRRFPLLVGSLAEHVARVGRLPLVDALGVSGPPPTAEAASAVRARDLLARTSVRDGVSFDGPVLLVDDTVRTRWTVTVASALLAEAGASQVMPLAVHLLP